MEARAQEWRSDMERDYRVIDVEEATGDLFIITNPAIIADEDSLVSLLLTAAKYKMENRWNGKLFRIALFSGKAFAHPKWKIPKKERKLWAENFLAEYDTKSRKAWMYPALPGKKKKLVIDTTRQGK
jgi:hypothetical protein